MTIAKLDGTYLRISFIREYKIS